MTGLDVTAAAPTPPFTSIHWEINEPGDDETVCVWIETEGIDYGLLPWRCLPRAAGFELVALTIDARVAHRAALTGCSCAAGGSCSLDAFSDPTEERVCAVLDETVRRLGRPDLVVPVKS